MRAKQLLVIVALLILAASVSDSGVLKRSAASNCLIDSSKAERSGCGQGNDILNVYVTNNCQQTMDIKICIQKEDGTYNCGLNYSVQPGRRMWYWACNGVTGYYKYYARPTGSNARFPEP